MYLERIEIQGFKSFAQKTTIEFPRPDAKSVSILKDDSKAASNATCGVTCIVGPNGSGKSNVVDAVRWVLGEQSLKSLRGKKSEDVIFAGSEKKSRLGMASVSLHINNSDGVLPVDYEEVVITRRLYRSGESEYILNKSKARLQDIVMLAAKANFGQKSYSIVSQGSIDHVLLASPAERKDFFDDAVGVKSFQIKRDQSINKLENAWNNLRQVDALLTEIKPRLNSLSRQVKRLERREQVEKDLRAVQQQYFGFMWHELQTKIKSLQPDITTLEQQQKQLETELQKFQNELKQLEQQDSRSKEFGELQATYQQKINQKNKLRERQLIIENKIEWAKEKIVERLAPLPIPEIVHKLKEIDSLEIAISASLEKGTADHLKQAQQDFKRLSTLIKQLIGQLEKPQTKERQRGEVTPEMLKELEHIITELQTTEQDIVNAQNSLENFNKKAEETKGAFFDIQRKLTDIQRTYNETARKLSELRVELARLETRQQDLQREVKEEMTSNEWLMSYTPATINERETHDEMLKLKRQLELIGGVEPEVIEEYNKVKERHDFLDGQSQDLNQSIKKLEGVITDLDQKIQQQFDLSFKNINKEFTKFFQILFNGGKAELKLIKEDPNQEAPEPQEGEEISEESSIIEQLTKAEANLSPKKFFKKRTGTVITGIEITATPPGKKVHSISMLSGGERSLASIALICAIIANNPSPFVILDEVDAALDEANTQRFGKIIDELSHKTQFIVITHNRGTMQHANVLYGVTMGDEGISKLISLQLEEAAKIVRQ